MKASFKLTVFCAALIGVGSVFALPPTIYNNQTIMQNATPAQCQAAARGIVSPEGVVTDSMYGADTGMTGAGVQTCTGCAVDANKNCTCSACYDYYN
jgi:hypothetical protein